jgi:hypothetical protein
MTVMVSTAVTPRMERKVLLGKMEMKGLEAPRGHGACARTQEILVPLDRLVVQL